MPENQPGTTPWVFQQDDLSFSDSNSGAAGINGSWLGRCCLTLGRSWMWLSCWSSPDILGWGKKGVGGFEREFLVMAEVQSHSSGWIRCLGLRCEHVTILRLWLSLQRTEMVPSWDLVSSSDVSEVGGFISVLQLTRFSALEVLLLLFTLKKLLLWQNLCEGYFLPGKENTSFAFPFSKTTNSQTLSGNVQTP